MTYPLKLYSVSLRAVVDYGPFTNIVSLVVYAAARSEDMAIGDAKKTIERNLDHDGGIPSRLQRIKVDSCTPIRVDGYKISVSRDRRERDFSVQTELGVNMVLPKKTHTFQRPYTEKELESALEGRV